MTDDILAEREQLPESEQGMLADDTERWHRMTATKGAHLDDWLAYGPGLMIRRNLAMRIAHVNKPEGKGYALAFNRLMLRDELDTMDKTSVSCLLWLYDDRQRLDILAAKRAEMTPAKRAKLNSPITARQLVTQVLRQRDAEAVGEPMPADRLTPKERLAVKDREIAELKAKLAKADGGSLFDLARDTGPDIGRTIGEHVGYEKAMAIAKTISDTAKQRRKRYDAKHKPALPAG